MSDTDDHGKIVEDASGKYRIVVEYDEYGPLFKSRIPIVPTIADLPPEAHDMDFAEVEPEQLYVFNRQHGWLHVSRDHDCSDCSHTRLVTVTEDKPASESPHHTKGY